MSWGRLAAAVAPAPAPAAPEPVLATRDLAQIMDTHIAWQTDGTGPERALSLPALFSVVRLIASTIDQLPLTVNGGPPPEWLRNPRRYGSGLDRGDLIQHVVTSMCLHGRASLLARRVGETSWRLDALHRDAVAVQVAATGVVGLDFQLQGQPIDRVPPVASAAQIGRDYLLHIPYLITPQHPEGASPVVSAGQALDGYLAVERQAATLLEQGDHYGGWLSTESDITADTAKRFQEKWMANRKTGTVPVLGAGLDWNPGAVSPDDAQWLESRLANAQAVASMFGVPPDMLGMTMAGGGSSLSYANSQDNNARFRANCLEAFTGQIADALSQLLPPGRGPDEEQRAEFDYTDWMGGQDADPDPATR